MRKEKESPRAGASEAGRVGDGTPQAENEVIIPHQADVSSSLPSAARTNWESLRTNLLSLGYCPALFVIFKHPGLTPADKLVYIQLFYHAGNHGDAYPSQDTLADELDMKRETINRSLKRLEKAGLIESGWQRDVSDSKHYRFKLNSYLAEALKTKKHVIKSHTRCDSSSHAPVIKSHSASDNASHKEIHEKHHVNNNSKRNQSSSQKTDGETDFRCCLDALDLLLPAKDKTAEYQMLHDYIDDFGAHEVLDVLKDMRARKITYSGVMPYLRKVLKERKSERKNPKQGRPMW